MWRGAAGLPAFKGRLQLCWPPLRFRPGETGVTTPSCGPTSAVDQNASLKAGNQVPGVTRAGERYSLAGRSLS